MINQVNITYNKNKQGYTVWLNNRIFLSQPIYYTNRIPSTITPQAYWYLHVLNVLQQHGLLNFYINNKKII